jgi:hypothetical protein
MQQWGARRASVLSRWPNSAARAGSPQYALKGDEPLPVTGDPAGNRDGRRPSTSLRIPSTGCGQGHRCECDGRRRPPACPSRAVPTGVPHAGRSPPGGPSWGLRRPPARPPRHRPRGGRPLRRAPRGLIQARSTTRPYGRTPRAPELQGHQGGGVSEGARHIRARLAVTRWIGHPRVQSRTGSWGSGRTVTDLAGRASRRSAGPCPPERRTWGRRRGSRSSATLSPSREREPIR